MRIKRKRSKFNFKFIIIIIAFLSVISFSYAYLNASLNITGIIRGGADEDAYIIDPESDQRLILDDLTRNRWVSSGIHSYNYSFDINNITEQQISSFNLVLEFNVPINKVDIWNFDYEIDGNKLIIHDTKNSLDNAEKTANVAFIVSSDSPILVITKVKIEGIDANKNNEFTPEQLPVTFAISNSWGSYVVQYDVTLTNKMTKNISGWQIEILLPQGVSLLNGWNANFIVEGNNLIINNLSYNGIVEPNKSITFGLQLNTTSPNYIPTITKRTGR